MNIMIDYDNTYTGDVDMWKKIIPVILMYGHNMYLVTSRGMDTPVELIQDFIQWKIPVVYCDYRAKQDVCKEQGINIDIWMDDDPIFITKGFVD